MLTWHLFTNDPTVLFELNGQTVLLQTQCLISVRAQTLSMLTTMTHLMSLWAINNSECAANHFNYAFQAIDWATPN